MKYILAIFRLLLGIIESVIVWVLQFFVLLFTIPVQRYNDTLYGRRMVSLSVRDVGDSVIITYPNGQSIKVKKEK